MSSRNNRVVAAVAAAILGLYATRAARAQSAYFSATGTFGSDDNKRQYFDFGVGTTTNATFRTWSWSGGTNAAGDAIPSGGVDPDLFLSNGGGGGLIAWNDDTFGADAYIQQNIGAGAYRLEQDFFYPPNSGLWAVDLTSSSAGSMTLSGLPNNGGPGVNTLAFGGNTGATAVLGVGTGNLIQVNNAIRAQAGGIISMTGDGTLSVASLEVGAGATLSYAGGTYAARDTRVRSGGVVSIGSTSILNIGAPAGGGFQLMWLDGGSLTGHWLDVGDAAVGSFNHGTASAASLEFLTVGLGGLNGAGSYRIDSGTLTVTNSMQIGVGSAVGTVNQVGGSVNTGLIYLGDSSGHGIYNLGGGTFATSNLSYIGAGSDGTFNQTGGVHQTNFVDIATSAGSAGTYLLSGGTLSTQQTFVGGQGRGVFQQTGGYNLSTTMALAANAGASGSYTLGGGTLQTSTLVINNNGTFLYNGGNFFVGSTRINPGGRLTAGTWLGLGVGSISSTVNLAGGVFDGYNVEVGRTGAGTVNQTGGQLTMHYLTVGAYPFADGTFSLSVGTINTTELGSFVGAYGGNGTFIQTGGTHNAYYVALGGNLGATTGNGTYLLGGGTINATAELVGDAARGTFIQTGGSNNPQSVVIANSPGAFGTFALAGGTLTTPALTVNTNGLFVYNNGAFNVVNTAINGGTFLVNGPPLGLGTTLSNGINLTAGVLSGPGQLNIGAGSAGFGTVNQSGGSNLVRELNIGLSTNAAGTYTLSGGTIGGNDLNLGVSQNGGGTFAQSAGTVREDAAIVLGGANATGISARGTYLLSGGSVSTVETDVGNYGIGTMLQTGGRHTTDNLLVGVQPTGVGRYALSGGTLQSSSGVVGSHGAGTFSHVGGSYNTGTLWLGASGGTGNYLVDGTASLVASTIRVDAGSQFVQQGGSVTAGTVNFGGNPARFSGNGGTLTITGAAGLNIGTTSGWGNAVVNGTSLNVANAFSVDAGATFTESFTQSQGTLSAGSATNNGTISLINTAADFGAGLTNNGTLRLSQSSTVTGVISGPSTSKMFVNDNGKLAAGAGRAHSTGSLTFAQGARLDVTDNALVTDYDGQSPSADIASRIRSGYGGGSWNGVGINSSLAAAASNTPHRTAIGYAEATAVGLAGGTFVGRPVDATSLLVRYTLSGDGNLDHAVDLTDFTYLAANFNKVGGATWVQGDYNYDGNVDLTDFTLLASNFNQSLSTQPAGVGAPVPEPTAVPLIVSALAAASQSRVRRCRTRR